MLEFWGIPREALDLKKQVLIPAQECFSSRKDELDGETVGKQAKCRSFLLPCLFMCAATEGMAQIQGGSPHTSDAVRSPHLCASHMHHFQLIQL